LARRVRGAQLPNTATPSLRRGPGLSPQPGDDPGSSNGGDTATPPAAADPAWPATPQTGPSAADGWANQSSAKTVYNFLSDFTSGVQRGLEESSPEDEQSSQAPAPDDNGSENPQ
jgi:hypothetical protein